MAVASLAVVVPTSAGPLSNAYAVDPLPDAVEGTAWDLPRTGFFVVGSFGSTLVGVLADCDPFAESFYRRNRPSASGLDPEAVHWFLPERE